jgi:WD40 repeat protein
VVSFLDVRSGRLTRPVDLPGDEGSHGSWHPDGVHYAMETEGSVWIWDGRTGRTVLRRRLPGADVREVDYSTDGNGLAVVEGSDVRLLDPETLAPLGTPAKLDDAPCAVSLGPDNHTAVVLTSDPERQWDFWAARCTRWSLVDLSSGDVLKSGDLPMAGASGGASLVDFSPDGAHAAVAGATGEVLVLDLRTGAPVRPAMTGHDGSLETLTYSPDGRRILTSASDSTAALWDGATGLVTTRVVAPTRFIGAGFLTGDQGVLVTSWFGGPAYRWDTDAGTAADFACEAAGRDLTRGEWRELFGDRPYERTCPGQ